MTDEQKAQIVVLYERGIRVVDIAAAVGCSAATVAKTARQNGLRRNSRADTEDITTGDTPQQVQQCLNCKAAKCIGSGSRCPLWR